MTALTLVQYARPQLEVMQFARNGHIPDAIFHTAIAEHGNHAAAFHVRQVARFSIPMQSIPNHDATRNRWRFAFHSSPYAYTLLVCMAISYYPEGAGNPYGMCRIDDGMGTIGDAIVSGGFRSTTATDVPAWISSGTAVLDDGAGAVAELDPDTDYYGTVSDNNDARLVSMTAWELSLPGDTDNDYVEQAFGLGQPILDVHRGDLATMLRKLWRRGAAHSWNWSVNLQSGPRTRTSATAANLIDTSVTTVSAASPGPTIDLTNRSTVRRGSVPMRLQVRAKMASGTGTVLLKDDGGTTLLTISVNSSTEQWWSGTVDLPATSAKYDVQFAGNGTNLLSVYAVSLYPYEA